MLVNGFQGLLALWVVAHEAKFHNVFIKPNCFYCRRHIGAFRRPARLAGAVQTKRAKKYFGVSFWFQTQAAYE
jgi:hypothetical protein